MEKEDLKFSVNNYLNMIYGSIKSEQNHQEKTIINEKAYRSSQLFTTSLFDQIVGKEKEKKDKFDKHMMELKANSDNFVNLLLKKSLKDHNDNLNMKKQEIIDINNRRQSINFVNSLVNNIKTKDENIYLQQDSYLEEEKNIFTLNQSKRETQVSDNKLPRKIWENLISCESIVVEIKQSKIKVDSILRIQDINKFSFNLNSTPKLMMVQNFYLKIKGKRKSLGITDEINFSIIPNQNNKRNQESKVSCKMEKYNSFSNYKIGNAETNIDNSFSHHKIPNSILNKSKIEDIIIKESRNVVKLNDLSLNKSLNHSKIHSSKMPLFPFDTKDFNEHDVSINKPVFSKAKLLSTEELVEKLKKNVEKIFDEYYENKIVYDKLQEKIRNELTQIKHLLISNKAFKERVFSKICKEDKFRLNILNDSFKQIVIEQPKQLKVHQLTTKQINEVSRSKFFDKLNFGNVDFNKSISPITRKNKQITNNTSMIEDKKPVSPDTKNPHDNPNHFNIPKNVVNVHGNNKSFSQSKIVGIRERMPSLSAKKI